MNFTITLQSVLTMLAYGVPGYLLIKSGKLNDKSISAFAALLMYVLQPFLTLDSFQKVTYSHSLFFRMGVFFVITLLLQALGALCIFAVVRKKVSNPSARISVISGVAGNVGFMGIPLMNALIPEYPEARAFACVYFLSMGIITWTLGSACVTGDVKYISIKKVFFNPTMLGMVVALPLFFLKIKLPDLALAPISLLAQMTTPVCMIILGMRFATVSIKEMLAEKSIYPSAGIKLILFPLLAWASVYFLPLSAGMKAALVIMSACPTANVVLSISELYGTAQKSAALTVLFSTLLSCVTIPPMMLILTV